MKYAADFETTVKADDCRVWAWALASVDDPEQVETGTDLDSFMKRCAASRKAVMAYFHNLKFDGSFILDWLFRNNFTWQQDKRQLGSRAFSTLITSDGKFYEIVVCFQQGGHHARKVTFRDSLKLLPFSVDAIARSFKLPWQKLELDYEKEREPGHELTDEERAYLVNDVRIMAKALQILFSQGLTKMTLGANALADFKGTMPFYTFDRYFPVPVYDEEIRQSYRGGYAFVNKKYKNKDVGAGVVLDVNSLYPHVMKSYPLPFGEGLHFEGKYKHNVIYNQFVQFFNCQFRLKPGFLPTIADKGFSGVTANYLETSGNEVYSLALTSVDYELFFRHYDVFNIDYIGGWMFKSKTGLFDSYIEKWLAIKTKAKEEGDKPMYTIAKLMQNSLYGKLATNPRCQCKIPVFQDNMVNFIDGPLEHREPLYIPAASFITAWARSITINAAQANIDRFLYCDTDSLHLLGRDLPAGLVIDPLQLGAWKHELNFSKARFVRAKCYLEYGAEPGSDQESWHVTAAGLPHGCHDQVTWDNFRPGVRYTDKLKPRRVPGGIILERIDFTITIN